MEWKSSLDIASGMAYLNPVAQNVLIVSKYAFIFAILNFILGWINFFTAKKKIKNNQENIGIKKKYKIFFLISIISFFIFLFAYILVETNVIPYSIYM